jgi:GTP cyclohydrolase I
MSGFIFLYGDGSSRISFKQPSVDDTVLGCLRHFINFADFAILDEYACLANAFPHHLDGRFFRGFFQSFPKDSDSLWQVRGIFLRGHDFQNSEAALMSNDRDGFVNGIRSLLRVLGEDPSREGLQKTPERYLRSLEFLTSGYKADVGHIMNNALFHESYNDMVIVRDIELYSLCEHHILPFFGRCHVAYIPNGKVIGLSKIPRIVDAFSRRLQVQERLTNEISQALQTHLQPRGVGVVIEAYHFCMMMRGVEKQNSYTMTSSMLGAFQELPTRSEFLSLLQSQRNR